MWESSDASGLGFQLSMYRLIDSWEESRRIKEDGRNAYNLTAMTINYDRLAGRYNDLVGRFNNLLDASQKTVRQAEQLQEQLTAREQEIAALRWKMANSEAQADGAYESLERSYTDYKERALAAEAELAALRSQQL